MADLYVATTGNDANDGLTEGNALLTPGYAASIATGSTTIYVKAGTYTCTTTTQNISGGPPSLPQTVQMEGYLTTPGDRAAWPVISAGGLTITTICDLSNPSFSKRNAGYTNIEVDGVTIANVTQGFYCPRNYNGIFYRCRARNCTNGFYMVGTCSAIDSFASACTFGFRGNSQSHTLRCWADACGHGWYTFSQCVQCVASNCTTGGFYGGSIFPFRYHKCTAYNCPIGFYHTLDIGEISQCLASDCTDGFWLTGNGDPKFYNNATWNATTAENNIINPVASVTCTADPLVDAAGDDFTTNDTAGGGADLAITYDNQFGMTYNEYIGAFPPVASGGSTLIVIDD